MAPGVAKHMVIWGLVIVLQGEAPGGGFISNLARVLPPAVLTVEAEDGDVQATLSITILDHVPDLGDAVAHAWAWWGQR